MSANLELINRAKELHRSYTVKVIDLFWWGGQNQNNKKLILYSLIKDIREKKRNGVYQEVEAIPSVKVINSLLSTSQINHFERVLQEKDMEITTTAGHLRDLLFLPAFQEAFNSLNPEEQINLKFQIMQGLSLTEAGRSLIDEIVMMNDGVPYESNPSTLGPIFHVTNLIKDNNYLETVNDTNKVVDLSAKVFDIGLEILKNQIPKGVGRIEITYFREVIARSLIHIIKTTNTSTGLNIVSYKQIVEYRYFKQFTVEIEYEINNNQDLIKKLGNHIGLIKLGVALFSLTIKIVDRTNNHQRISARELVELGLDLIGALDALHNAMEKYSLKYQNFLMQAKTNFKVTSKLIGIVSKISIPITVVLGAIDTVAAIEKEDYSVATGHVVNLGGALALEVAAAAALGKSAAAVATAGAVGGPVTLVVAGIVLIGIGVYLIYATKDPELENWFKYNYFGVGWNDLDREIDPEGYYYNWKLQRGRPNIEEQLNRFISILHPLNLERADLKRLPNENRRFYFDLEKPRIPVEDFQLMIEFVPGPSFVLDIGIRANKPPLEDIRYFDRDNESGIIIGREEVNGEEISFIESVKLGIEIPAHLIGTKTWEHVAVSYLHPSNRFSSFNFTNFTRKAFKNFFFKSTDRKSINRLD